MLLHITVIDTFPVIFKILTYFHLTYLWDVSISFIYLHTHYMIFYEPFKSIEYISPFLCMLCATWLPSLCICNYCYSANIHFISTIFHDFLTFHNNLLKYFPNRNLWNKPESKANHFFQWKDRRHVLVTSNIYILGIWIILSVSHWESPVLRVNILNCTD